MRWSWDNISRDLANCSGEYREFIVKSREIGMDFEFETLFPIPCLNNYNSATRKFVYGVGSPFSVITMKPSVAYKSSSATKSIDKSYQVSPANLHSDLPRLVNPIFS